jgi:hypothetical protein
VLSFLALRSEPVSLEPLDLSVTVMRSPTHHHSLYGDIPLIQREEVGRDGQLYVWREYDPDYKPKVPQAAFPAM